MTRTREPPARRLPVPGPLAVSLPVTARVLARYDISSRHRRGAVTRTLSTVYGYRLGNFSSVQEEGPWGRLTWPVSSGKTIMASEKLNDYWHSVALADKTPDQAFNLYRRV